MNLKKLSFGLIDLWKLNEKKLYSFFTKWIKRNYQKWSFENSFMKKKENEMLLLVPCRNEPYETVPNRTRPYPTVPDSFETVPDHTRPYSTVSNRNYPFHTVSNRTRTATVPWTK